MNELFLAAMKKVVWVYEGLGYSNTPGDAGGETFAGISRRFHPKVKLWGWIDSLKGMGVNMRSVLATDKPDVYNEVCEFYYNEFWLPSACDALGPIASVEQFDSAVNLGVGGASMKLQQILNALNNGGKKWGDIAEDGDCGPATRRAIASFRSMRWVGASGDVSEDKFLSMLINHMQASHYFKRISESPDQEKFAVSWFMRT